MASIGSEHASRSRLLLRPSRLSVAGAIERVRVVLADGSDFSLARRLAGAAFLIRVASAVLAFVSQIVLARWLGSFEFGIYVYVWTWVLLICGMVDLGLGSAAQRLIPEYIEHRHFALLRGFLRGSQWLASFIATAVAVVAALVVYGLSPHIGPSTVWPLYIACAVLPICGLGQVQSGIARSYGWVNLGLSPTYVLRQILLLALLGVAFVVGLPMNAATATLTAAAAWWAVTLGQWVVLERRLTKVVEPGPKAYAVRSWLSDLDADLRRRGVFSPAHLCGRAGAADFPPAERGRHLLRRLEDHGAGRLHLFLGGADAGAQIRRVSRYRRPQTARRFSRHRGAHDILAVAWLRSWHCWRWASRCCGCSGANSRQAII